jgi:D-beta-D-heptose 7-phosphate kinase/D-beta-D-heptose 1-phosphate adenosyltransferase
MIKTLNKLKNLREECNTDGRLLVMTSGGFDPIHPGHISLIEKSKTVVESTYRTRVCLAVVVNGDWFLRNKKGRPFMNLKDRCKVVDELKWVDYTIPFEVKGDSTVNEALVALRPHFFTKGGDRIDELSIPEWRTCDELNVTLLTGIGESKKWSSSSLVEQWEQFLREKRNE